MRRRIWIPLVVVLAVCLLLLFRTKQPQRSVTSQPGEAATNQPSPPSQAVQSQPAESAKSTSAPALSPDLAAEMARSRTPEGSNEIQERALARWQAPINFYGKVIDENSNGVAGADITFGWSEFPTEAGARRATTKSDAAGLFSLHDKRGPALDIWASKEGYYASHGGQRGFSYMNGDFSPDPRSPVIFNLRKKGKGESLITSSFPDTGQIAQLHHDGTPVELDLFKGAQVPAGSGQLRLEFWRAITNRNANIFDWKCQLSVPGGGLVETPEEFAFQAAESGYQSPIVIDMPATNENWQGEIRSKYYMRLPDGKYGRVDFYFLPNNGVFTVQSAINPDGSRNLEPPP